MKNNPRFTTLIVTDDSDESVVTFSLATEAIAEKKLFVNLALEEQINNSSLHLEF